MREYFIEGHALTSSDGFIADERGEMFPFLHHPLDWEAFQKRLNEAAIVVLGRKGHEKHPQKGRKRLILTSQVHEPRQEGLNLFWNPVFKSFDSLHLKGLIAVTGGQSVFDLFLKIGYDKFILNRLPHLNLHKGLPLFSNPVNLNNFRLSLHSERVLDQEKLLISQEWRKV
jgi:dihydrofolate reductase